MGRKRRTAAKAKIVVISDSAQGCEVWLMSDSSEPLLAPCPVADWTSATLGGGALRVGSLALGLTFAAMLALESFPASALGHAGAGQCSARR